MTIKAFLLDIEGTTTAISFVYDELFPYVRRELRTFVTQTWDTQATRDDVVSLRSQIDADVADGLQPPAIPNSAGAGAVDAVVANVLWQMDNDRKTTGLKSLQGRMWVSGYTSGELKGHLFDDVEPAIRRWHAADIQVHIYSSGSVAAQKLLFSHSVAGDLTPVLSGYFDTTSGGKKEADSYARIAAAIGFDVSELHFVTDNPAEAVAAREAGMPVSLSVREGNPDAGVHDFTVVATFDELPV